MGILICFLLSQQHAGLSAFFCPARASCETVLTSRYAAVAGIPLPLLGGLFYTTMLGMLLAAYGIRSNAGRVRLLGGAHWLAIVGFTFSVGLMYLQFGVLHAFCPLCTMSAFVMGGLLLATARAGRMAAINDWTASPTGAMTLAVFALFPAIILLTSTFAEQDEVLAVVDGQKFTRRQMKMDLRASLSPLEQKAYSLESEWIQEKVDQTLLALEATRLRTTIDEMLVARASAERPVSEQEVEARLGELKLPHLAENLASVRSALDVERRQLAKDGLLKELTKVHDVKIYLEKPALRALQIDPSTVQWAGSPAAKVQLVVFSDFQCPFCQELAPILKRVRDRFPQEVALGFRHFPLEAHRRAFPAAVAAECAAEQGAFWEYHDKLFAEAGKLEDPRFLALAASLGLDQSRFAECLKSQNPKERVEASRQDAVKSGLEGVPAVFLNGLRVEGDLNYDNLVRKIDEALQSHSGKIGQHDGSAGPTR
jgi:protein-disulfide isomerase/uncharacterized membrane protein